jgi:hypothetical protein
MFERPLVQELDEVGHNGLTNAKQGLLDHPRKTRIGPDQQAKEFWNQGGSLARRQTLDRPGPDQRVSIIQKHGSVEMGIIKQIVKLGRLDSSTPPPAFCPSSDVSLKPSGSYQRAKSLSRLTLQVKGKGLDNGEQCSSWQLACTLVHGVCLDVRFEQQDCEHRENPMFSSLDEASGDVEHQASHEVNNGE